MGVVEVNGVTSNFFPQLIHGLHWLEETMHYHKVDWHQQQMMWDKPLVMAA